MYSGPFELPKFRGCGIEVGPGELSENFICPNCKIEQILYCEESKANLNKYQCLDVAIKIGSLFS